MTIGAENAEAKGFFFSQSSPSPGNTFLVPKATFEKTRERIAFFAKR
jgi:hypothetical protein